MHTVLAILLALAAMANSPERSGSGPADSVQGAIDEAMAKSRAAIDRFGATDSAMLAIQTVLADLAAVPGIKTHGTMKNLHGSSSMGRALLASESDSGISLYVTWFGKDAATPVHDHLTWGVIRVLEGRDKYIHWKRHTDTATGESHVVKAAESVLQAGESLYWPGPPDDVHSQQAVDREFWELVMVGRDLSSDYVSRNQQRFDPNTGRAMPRKSN